MTTIIDKMAVELAVERGGFRTGLDGAVRDLETTTRRMEQEGERMSRSLSNIIETGLGVSLANIAGQLSHAIGGLLGDIAQLGTAFDDSMRKLGAAADIGIGQLGQISYEMRQVGLATGEGAAGAATVAKELMKAGVSMEDAANGATEAVIRMAQANEADLPESVDVAVQAMLLFGKRGEEMGEVVKAATAYVSGTRMSIRDLAGALGMGGQAAVSAGISMEEFHGALVASANAFTSGSDQGTAFKTFIQRLTPASKEAADEMLRLGFSAYDASGSLKPLQQIADELQAVLSGMSTEFERNNALQTIFGTDAIRMAQALAQQRDVMREVTTSTIQKTDADSKAELAMSGVTGATKRLNAAMQEFGIVIGEAGLTKAQIGFTDWLADLVKWSTEAARGLDLLAASVKYSGKTGGLVGAVNPKIVNAASAWAAAGAGAPPAASGKGKTFFPTGSGEAPKFSSASPYALFAQDPAPDRLNFDTEGAKRLSTAVTEIVNETDEMKKGFDRAAESFADGFADAIIGAKSLGDALRGLAADIAKTLLRKSIADPIAGALSKGLGSIFGGFFADGGSPPVGRVSIVGERGPELFVPKGAGTIIPNHALGGGVSVTYAPVINAPGADSAAVAEIRAALAADRSTRVAQVTAIVQDGFARRRFRV